MDQEAAMTTITVGVDRSEASAAALHWAAAEARRVSAELQVVHAYLAPVAYVGTEAAIARVDPELDREVNERLARFVAAAEVDLTDLEVTYDLHPGRATDGLLTRADEVDLLVVGTRGGGGFAGLRLGSTAEHCARHAPCPVVVVPPATEDREPTRRTVVGVDGSDASRHALAWAVRRSEQREGDVVEALGVYEPYDAPGPYGGSFMRIADPGSTERFRRRVAAEVEEAVTTIEPPPRVEVTTAIVAGHPAAVLVQRGAGADLLVVGRRGRHGFATLLLGSITRQVLHHTTVPVAVVPS
jgi:nucleotide-binding universal stress UspA family protein